MDAWMQSYKDLWSKKWDKIPKFKKNDVVRVKIEKGAFSKGYTPRFSDELFLIDEIIPGCPITYYVKDFNNSRLGGMYYAEELSKVNSSIDDKNN